MPGEFRRCVISAPDPGQRGYWADERATDAHPPCVELFTGALGRGGAATALGIIVLLAMWITLLPLLGEAAFWIGLVLAAATALGVLRRA